MFVHRHAVQLGLKGWVRNLNDGRVEVWAQGDDGALKKFDELVQSGPARGRVDRVETSEQSANDSFTEFTVKQDGVKPWPEKY